jgi:hypothetical protein
MQQHLREHTEVVERIKQHIDAQKNTLANLETTREEIRNIIRADEDAKEQLRKAQQTSGSPATSDAYGGGQDGEDLPQSGSSPFASASSSPPTSTPAAAPFTNDKSPFKSNDDLNKLQQQLHDQDRRTNHMEAQITDIHKMLMQLTGGTPPATTPAPPAAAPFTPPQATTVGPTGTPVAPEPTEDGRLPQRTPVQHTAKLQEQAAKRDRAAAASTHSRAARAQSVERARRTEAPSTTAAPPPPDATEQTAQANTSPVVDIESDDDHVHTDGTGARA